MKPKSNPFFFCAFATASATAFCTIAPLHAAEIDTTGTTIVLDSKNPQNKYIGDGTLEVSGGEVWLDHNGSNSTTEFAMTDGVIDILSEKKLINGGWQKGVWDNNRADLQVNGTFDIWDGKPVYVDALVGSGAITKGHGGNSPTVLTVGVNQGGGTFRGAISNDAGQIAFTKNGSGTQVLTGTNTYSGATIINGGTLQIGDGGTSGTLGSGAVTMASGANLIFHRSDDFGTAYSQSISGAGNLTKSGEGTLTLSGSLSHSGLTTISGGTLVASQGFTGATSISIGSGATLSMGAAVNNVAASLEIASGATLNLDFQGTSTVGTLRINGSEPLPAGIYNSDDETYGSYFTGGGALEITFTTTGDSTWTATEDGDWNNDTNWQDYVIPSGFKTATFNAATGATVFLNDSYYIENLVFDVSDYTLTGSSPLTLVSTDGQPTTTVATGISARIETVLAGVSGLLKNGGGTLTLSAANTYTGPTNISAGTLIASHGFPNATAVNIASDATLRIESARTDWPGGNSFSGAGTLIFDPGDGNIYDTGGAAGMTIQIAQGGLIHVQSGTVRQRWGYTHNWSGNRAGMTIDSGAVFDVWDAYNIEIDALNGGGTLRKTEGGWVTPNVNIGQAGGSGSFSGTISNTVSGFNLIKNGGGTQALTGTTSFTGSLVVNGGTLSLGNGTSSTMLPDQNAVIIANGAILDLNFSGSDTVSSVQLGGNTYTAPGNYDATTYPEFFTGTGSLVIPGADPFASWIDGYFPGITDPSIIASTADPDYDGISNLVEYVLQGGDPNAAHADILPELDATGENFIFTFYRRIAATGTTQTFQYGSDLSGWTDVPVTDGGIVSISPSEEGVEMVRISITKGTETKLFGRLQVEK